MRESLLNYIVCPTCQSTFELAIENRDDGHIMEGTLQCKDCGAHYQIKEGIPRLVDDKKIDDKNRGTAERFGQQWESFDFIHVKRYTAQFLDWIAPIQQEFFAKKVILDAGCGKGRHCIASSQFHAKDVIGIDLAEGAVKSAFRNTRELPNIHILQANIYHLPFKNDSFDYIYSIGVLHHTPEPKRAFACLVEKLKKSGTISAWVYGREGNWWIIHLLNPIRKYVTSKLPLLLLKMLAFSLTLVLQTVLKLVYAPVNKNRALKPLSRFLFYNEYLDYISHFPFMENYLIVFDHLLPEIAFYIEKDEFHSWFTENNLHNIRITMKTNNSWRGKGDKIQV